jgi:hypothetical protein
MLRGTFLVERQLAEDLLLDVGIGVGCDDLFVLDKAMKRHNTKPHTFNAKTVLPPFRIHRVTAPPAPSPKLPSSITLFSIWAMRHPSSSKLSTSSVLALSRVAWSYSGGPVMLPSLSIPTPPSLALEYDDPAADAGSGVPLGWLSIPY